MPNKIVDVEMINDFIKGIGKGLQGNKLVLQWRCSMEVGQIELLCRELDWT